MSGLLHAAPTEWGVVPFDPDARVVLVPIRHHSPACARHLTQLLEHVRPEAVLIEAPADADPLIEHLLHEETEPPIALYTTWTEERRDADPIHHASYWPLCAYSPEWIALRTGHRLGARLRFIDLPFPAMVRAGRREDQQVAQSLQDERHLQHARLLAAAARAAGVRDADELWDHLFECPADTTPARFFDRVLAYCAAARHGADQRALAEDGTLERESHMAACIAEETGRVVVVTGGFHTIALATTAPQRPHPRTGSAGVTLMRYGHLQLDRLNGYAAGMPSPGFYGRQWCDEELERTLAEFARELRAVRGEGSVAHVINAVGHARAMAALRGHARIGREDLLDAIRSTFVDGSLDVEGVVVLAVARKFLAGDARGRVPASAGTPPLIADFEAAAARHRLTLDSGEEHEVTLDTYRRAAHRACSRTMHRLALLDVPFARRVRGPDFVHGRDLDRIQEVWRYRWQPATESGLIEASRYGGSLREAASARLVERLGAIAPGDRPAAIAAELLLVAAACGLHDQLARIARRVGELLTEDGDFVSVVAACDHLALAAAACEPLELHDRSLHGDAREGVRELALTAWRRAALLLPTNPSWPDDTVGLALEALTAWREAAARLGDEGMLEEHADEVLEAVLRVPAATPEIAGAALGLLHGSGRVRDRDVALELRGRLAGAPVAGCRFLRGLLRTDRSAAWQVEDLLAAVDAVISGLAEADFLRLCPHLRLAFADLTPREIDRLGAAVAQLAGVTGWRTHHRGRFEIQTVLAARAVDSEVREVLREDGLGGWLDG